MTKDEAKFFLTEWAAGAVGIAGGVMMAIGDFRGDLAAWGLTLLAVGGGGFAGAYWLRRQCSIRLRQRFRR